MVRLVGLNWGSLMSARNLALSLTSPSYSVLTNSLPIIASRTRSSRFTWASFHRCSMTRSLVSCESSFDFWAPAWLSETRASSRQQHVARSIALLVRHIPTWGGRSGKHNSRLLAGGIQIRGGSLRTYLRAKARIPRGTYRSAEALLRPHSGPGSELR